MHWGDGKGSAAFIDFDRVNEWLIVPPEDSPIRAKKIDGRICTNRAAYRVASSARTSRPPTRQARSVNKS